jgi:hypothetical protein
MKKTLLAFFAAAMSLFCAPHASAVVIGDFDYSITYFVGYDGPQAVVQGLREGYNPTGALVIPDYVEYEGEQVEVVGLGWFDFTQHEGDDPVIYNCEGITSVTLPASLRILGSNEFVGCPNIKEYKVKAGSRHFKSMDGLLCKAVSYDEDRWELFRYPSGRTDVSFALPVSLESICMGAFASNKYVRKLFLSGSQILEPGWQYDNHTIESIDCSSHNKYSIGDDGAVYYRKGLVALLPGVEYDKFAVSGTLTSVSSGAFCSSNVKTISWSDKLKGIAGKYMFMGSSVETINFKGEAPEVIGMMAFYDCRNLKSIRIGMESDATLTIYESAFRGCESLESVETPEGLKSIDFWHNAFNGCRSLSTFTIDPKAKIEELPVKVFYGCESLESFSFVNVKGLNKQGYQFAGSGLTIVRWPTTLVDIPEGCFADCKKLAKLELKDNTEDIYSYAFARSGLTAVSMRGTEWFATTAFMDCPNLMRIYYPANDRSVVTYTGITFLPDNAQVIINNPKVSDIRRQKDYRMDNVSLYMSMETPGQDIGSGWQRVCAPGRYGSIYRGVTTSPVEEMYYYATYPEEKAVEVTSLMPEVKIKGVTIEGVEAVLTDGKWVAEDAVISDRNMNVTVSYTVSNNPMTTTYEYTYTGVNLTESETDIEIAANEGGHIILTGETGWRVYTTSGLMLLSGHGDEIDLRAATPGIYIIEAGTTRRKIRR